MEIVEISPYLNMTENVFFEKNPYLVRKKFNLAFFDICNSRNMYSVTKLDRKIVCRRFVPVKPNFHFLAPVKVRFFVEFLICILFLTCILFVSCEFSLTKI